AAEVERVANTEVVDAVAWCAPRVDLRANIVWAGAWRGGGPIEVVVVTGEQVAVGVVQIERQIQPVVHTRDIDGIDLTAHRAKLEPILVTYRADAVAFEHIHQDQLSA